MNWSDFFAQGGYGFFVWGSYLITLLVLGGEVLVLLRRKRGTRVPPVREHYSPEAGGKKEI